MRSSSDPGIWDFLVKILESLNDVLLQKSPEYFGRICS